MKSLTCPPDNRNKSLKIPDVNRSRSFLLGETAKNYSLLKKQCCLSRRNGRMISTASLLVMLCRIFCLIIGSVPQITGNIECYSVKKYRKVTRKQNFIDRVTGKTSWLQYIPLVAFCKHWKERSHKDRKVLILSGISLIRNPICSPKEYKKASFVSVTQHIKHVIIDTA